MKEEKVEKTSLDTKFHDKKNTKKDASFDLLRSDSPLDKKEEIKEQTIEEQEVKEEVDEQVEDTEESLEETDDIELNSDEFDIEISDDGENFTTILEDQASSMQEDFEVFALPETASARYVRYRGYGSSANSWNSITEFAVLAQESDAILPDEEMDTTVSADSDVDKDKTTLIVSIESNTEGATPDTGDDSSFSIWVLLLSIMGVLMGSFACKKC